MNRDIEFTYDQTSDGMIRIMAHLKGYKMATYVSKEQATDKVLLRSKIEILANSLRDLTRYKDD